MRIFKPSFSSLESILHIGDKVIPLSPISEDESVIIENTPGNSSYTFLHMDEVRKREDKFMEHILTLDTFDTRESVLMELGLKPLSEL